MSFFSFLGTLLGGGTTTVATPPLTAVRTPPLMSAVADLPSLRLVTAGDMPEWAKAIIVGTVLLVAEEFLRGIFDDEEGNERHERHFDYGNGTVAPSDVEAFYTERVGQSWRTCIRTRSGHSYCVQSFDGDRAENLATAKVKELSGKFHEEFVRS